MKSYNGKVQMMDAGMTMFESEQNFGNVLGQVKAEMEVYGKVLRPSEIGDAELPESTGTCDLFLDWSTAWRVRYISCHLESAGEIVRDGKTLQRYAATFKEGNKSTVLRGCVMLVLLLSFVADVFVVDGALCTIINIVLAAFVAYLWILPSRKAQRVISKLMASMKSLR